MHGERASTVRLREPTEPERKNLHFVLHDACGCTATAAESGRRGSTRGRAVSRRGWVCPLVARSVWRCEGRLRVGFGGGILEISLSYEAGAM